MKRMKVNPSNFGSSKVPFPFSLSLYFLSLSLPLSLSSYTHKIDTLTHPLNTYILERKREEEGKREKERRRERENSLSLTHMYWLEHTHRLVLNLNLRELRKVLFCFRITRKEKKGGQYASHSRGEVNHEGERKVGVEMQAERKKVWGKKKGGRNFS